ncbi:hypothetical protein CFIO01_13408 [Colletotrichum fioriniae PJ7]|uniref:Uncharacterized protein n=1 Tax=Colletotrichum fioriniae PJ7 TaxID=1445577 RepID=A0A010QR64_9PEZI|nr:hypothetical protein CFIO01_13408 [Colletotrichum fioriniae PJ7]
MEGRSGKIRKGQGILGLDRACGHGPDDICTSSVPVTNRMSSAPSVDEAYAERPFRRRRTADVLAVRIVLWAVDPDGGYHSSQPADGCTSPPDEDFHTPSRNGKEAGLPLHPWNDSREVSFFVQYFGHPQATFASCVH